PAIVAQAAATSACLTDFRLGVGTGEALNEHVVNAAWPPHAVRLEMLEEAVEVMRRLWTGELVTHRGEHYEVDTARLYTLPDKPPQVFVSGFGEKSVELAGRIGDGYVCTAPSADLVKEFHEAGGHGKPVMGGFKACYDLDPDKARATIHRIWPNQGIKGEASQLLPLPRHFEQLSEMVDEASAVDGSPCGPDPRTHLEVCREYAAAGFDEVYVAQVGPEQDAFFDFYARHVLPELS
ncbi:MAG: TIGR03557 family F420-dependent LLM class oxidoreductase, partial [Nonomuraea sp.]|nr:TIGR03557 family F420-dependent LLM class oxidoreductase [Nonomuraea sp.]